MNKKNSLYAKEKKKLEDKPVGLTSSLYVDLDGTFIKSDTLFESFIVAIKSNPFIIFICIGWLIKGKSYFKHQLSQHADIAIQLLPVNPEFYTFLIKEKEKGREIVLATASNEKYAKSVCDIFDLFDAYISSDIDNNLKGKDKLLKIKSLSERYSYAGNSSEDFVLFEQAEESYLVNPTKKARKMSLDFIPTRLFDNEKQSVTAWLKQLRVHQWIKNSLIFVPLLVSGYFVDIGSILLSLIGFFSFSFLASATYIINDLLDLNSDRNHKQKKYRPLASGSISIVDASLVAAILFILAIGIALSLDGLFIYVLTGYLLLTLVYSFKIKQYIGMDVIALAMLYTIRILAGAVILNVTVSFWLFSFSMFVFLSLALIKRCAELKSLEGEDVNHTTGRDYNLLDYSVLMNLGTSSAMLSILMFSFYVNSNVLADQYQQPTLLWLIVPALCYWMMRMWIKTHRGEMHDDPIVFTLKDNGSLVTIGFIGLTALLAQIL